MTSVLVPETNCHFWSICELFSEIRKPAVKEHGNFLNIMLYSHVFSNKDLSCQTKLFDLERGGETKKVFKILI